MPSTLQMRNQRLHFTTHARAIGTVLDIIKLRGQSSLGTVVGALLRTATALDDDPISEYYGFHPDPHPTLVRVAAHHGWCLSAIPAELTRRGVSAKWQYENGVGQWEEPHD